LAYSAKARFPRSALTTILGIAAVVAVGHEFNVLPLDPILALCDTIQVVPMRVAISPAAPATKLLLATTIWATILGAYFSKEIAEAEPKGRFTSIDVSPDIPVHTAWDLGIGDSTAIWFSSKR